MADAEKLAHDLNALIELDLDAIEAYEAAIARLVDAGDKVQLGRFLEDHRRHVNELTPLVLEADGRPATSPDFKRVLTKGKVVVMSVAGDIGILEAMKSNEETTSRTYDKARRNPGLPLEARNVIERNYSDEAGHLAWIEQRVLTLRKSKQSVRHA
jgi:rubrerythrin